VRDRPGRRRRLPRLQLRHGHGWALARAGAEPVELWHEHADLQGVAAVVLPGGFAYGDYLRAGAIARFSPVMRAVAGFAADGGLVLGICNGFQVSRRPVSSRGRSCATDRCGSCAGGGHPRGAGDTAFTHRVPAGGSLRMPVAHGEGCYYADAATLDALERDGQVLFRYNRRGRVPGRGRGSGEPDGSLRAVAGVVNAAGNVAGAEPATRRGRGHAARVGRRDAAPAVARRLGGARTGSLGRSGAG